MLAHIIFGFICLTVGGCIGFFIAAVLMVGNDAEKRGKQNE